MSTVICIASGPSLTQYDVGLCERSELPLLAVNNAFQMVGRLEYHYAADLAWWQHYYPYTHAGSRKFNIQGRSDEESYPGVEQMKRGEGECFSAEWPILCTGKNSGYQAINLAYLLGFEKIILLGYDVQFTNNRVHWHGKHDHLGARNPIDHTIAEWQRIYRKMAPTIQQHVQVINATRDTALNCFPVVELEEALYLWATEVENVG